jgi:hypothetical protein
MGNIGYACINMTLGKKGILTGRAMRKATLELKGLSHASQLALQNALDLETILNAATRTTVAAIRCRETRRWLRASPRSGRCSRRSARAQT